MKHVLLFCFFLLALRSSAQYAPFPTPGMQYGQIYNCNIYDCPDFFNISMRYQKDTSLCGEIWADFGGGYIRADSGKYFILQSASNCNSQLLMYDFTLNTGDTINTFDMGEMVVYQTGMVTLNDGVQRKRIKLRSIDPQNPWAEQTWIDGIGEANRDFFRNSDWEGGYGQVICIRDNAGMIYQNTARVLDCDSLLCPVPHSNFSFECEGKTFSFKNESVNSDQAFWDFGDGESGSGENPVHTYAAPGCYKVTLTVRSNCLPQDYINYKTINVDALNYWAPAATTPALSFGHIQFLDNQHGWGIAYPNQIWKTSDGGITWENVDYPGPDRQLGEMQFKNFQQGIIEVINLDSLPGNILWTDDGANFKLSKIDSVSNFTALERLSDSVAVASGQFKGVFVTKDGGNTWVQKSVPGAVTLIEDFEQTDDGVLRFYGVSQFVPIIGFNIIGKSVDLGDNWSLQSLPGINSLKTLRFLNTSEGWLGGFSGLFHTTDGGETWNKLHNATFGCLTFGFADALHGWGGGFNTGIYYTADGGQSWVQQACVYRNSTVRDLHVFGDTVALALAGGPINRFSTQPYQEITCGASAADIAPENRMRAFFAPNPAHAHAIFNWENAPSGSSVLSLYNLSGQVVRQQNLSDNQGNTTILTANIPAGMYFWKWQSVTGEIITGKLIVQH